MSLRRRVLLGFLLVAVALVVTNTALTRNFEDDLLDRTDEDLLETARRPVFPRFGPGGEGPEVLSDLYIGTAERDGTGLQPEGERFDPDASPPRLTPDQLVRNLGDAFTTPSVDGDGSWRVVSLPAIREQGFAEEEVLLVVGSQLDQVEATLRRMRLIQLLGSAAVLAALGAVLWWVLRLGVRPLVSMAGTAEEIAAGDLSRRVDHVDERTEAGRMGVAFNSMLTEIEQAFRQREASEARLRQFAADASHELRTPLTSIRGYAELYEAGGLRDPDELDQAMHRLSSEGRRMGTLVEDLLLLARLDQQRPLEQQAVRLDLLASDAVGDALAVEPDRPITIETAPVTVRGDDQRLRQVVGNLLTNAQVHTPPGTPVHVRVSSAGGIARLEVRDEGPGIPPEVVDHVFERFYRSDASRVRSTGGSGLGLSIVDAVARSHAGGVTVTSTVGSGTTFVVELPVDATDPQPPHSDLQGTDPIVEP